MQQQIIAAHNIKDTKDGKDESFDIPDLIKLMGATVAPGDEVFIPVSVRDDKVSLWETGGRNPKQVLSIGNIITGPNDKLLDAVLFNKLNKVANGKHALIPLRPGHCVYAGKIRIRENSVAPKIKVIKLSYTGLHEPMNTSKTYFGRFVVSALYTNYGDIQGCIPAERLINKLYTVNVEKPFFANGWSISNLNNIKEENRESLTEIYSKLAGAEISSKKYALADNMMDNLEDEIVSMENKKLSVVLQVIDFDRGITEFRPLKNVSLSNVIDTIGDAELSKGYVIGLEQAKGCYNQALLFNSNDIPSIELGMKYDHKFAVYIGDRKYALLRGWRG